MKFTKVTAAILSVTALATMPCIPEVANLLPDYSISASAVSMPEDYITVNGISYVIQTDDDGTKMASVNGVNTSSTTLTIPATISWKGKSVQVKCINASAFYASQKLQNVDLTKATYLRRIYDDAFRGSSVTTIKIGSTATNAPMLTIGNNVFTGSKIQTATFYGRSVQMTGYTFSGCDYLNTVSFESTVKYITLGEGVFCGNRALRNVSFKNSSVDLLLGKYTFSSSMVNNITFPSTLKTIPDYCFQYCTQLTNFQIPSSVTTLGKGAFEYAYLPSTVRLSKNLKYVNDTAFANLNNTSTFIVETGNTAIKTINSALYSYDGNTLYCYPPKRYSTSFTCNARTIPDGAIANNPYLVTLSLPNYIPRSMDTRNFYGLTSLENLTVSSVEASRSDFVGRYKTVFDQSKLHKINGNEIVVAPSNAEPYFYSKYSSYIKEHFDEYAYYDFMEDYVDKMATYVAKTVTNSSMTDLQKAVKLRKWILDRVTYDPEEAKYWDDVAKGVLNPSGAMSSKNHVDASVFLHQRNGVRYTVCEGYAKCYALLLNKAGIEAYVCSGGNKKQYSLDGHAWNMLKLGGKWYHADCCWDDQSYEAKNGLEYNNFLCTDATFNSNGHQNYYWVLSGGPSTRPAAVTNIAGLGNVNRDSHYDKKDLEKLKTYIGKTVTTDQSLINADIDMDGKITQNDYNLLSACINSSTKEVPARGWIFKYYE